MFWDNDTNADYDYKKLCKDLENEYMCQGIGFSGGFGAMQMMDASTASEKQLLCMAKEEGVDVEKCSIFLTLLLFIRNSIVENKRV